MIITKTLTVEIFLYYILNTKSTFTVMMAVTVITQRSQLIKGNKDNEYIDSFSNSSSSNNNDNVYNQSNKGNTYKLILRGK